MVARSSFTSLVMKTKAEGDFSLLRSVSSFSIAGFGWNHRTKKKLNLQNHLHQQHQIFRWCLGCSGKPHPCHLILPCPGTAPQLKLCHGLLHLASSVVCSTHQGAGADTGNLVERMWRRQCATGRFCIRVSSGARCTAQRLPGPPGIRFRAGVPCRWSSRSLPRFVFILALSALRR